jgi:Mn-dependent DtxR family transcriptional regulator
MTEKKNICDLPLNDYQKMVLTYIGSRFRTTYEIAAKTKHSYSSVNQTLGILTAMGYVKKIKKMAGGVVYTLKDDVTA